MYSYDQLTFKGRLLLRINIIVAYIGVATPDEYGIPYENLALETSDGLRIKGYLMKQHVDLYSTRASGDESTGGARDNEVCFQSAPGGASRKVLTGHHQFASSRPTVIMFHGNAGNIGNHIPLARMFYVGMRCNVVLMSYRG